MNAAQSRGQQNGTLYGAWVIVTAGHIALFSVVFGMYILPKYPHSTIIPYLYFAVLALCVVTHLFCVDRIDQRLLFAVGLISWIIMFIFIYFIAKQ